MKGMAEFKKGSSCRWLFRSSDISYHPFIADNTSPLCGFPGTLSRSPCLLQIMEAMLWHSWISVLRTGMLASFLNKKGGLNENLQF